MDLSALQAAARTLERSLDSLGFWFFASTALVVAGLIAEYRHEIVEFWEEVRRPAAMFPWQKFWAIVGGVLVTVGVAGELIVGIKASSKEGGLRTINHQIEALLSDKASENERQAEQLSKDAEALKSENLKLEALIQPRSLTLKQQQDIGAACSKFSGHRVKLYVYVGDTEGKVLAAQMSAQRSRSRNRP
jgi:hypothetical protein